MTALDRVIANILEREGGVADVGDGKGVTRFGQTRDWLDDQGFTTPTSVADAAVNYAAWMRRYRLAELCQRHEYIGDLVTDWAVHSGLSVAVRALQRVLGLNDDGVIGPKTLAAVTPERAPQIARALLAARTVYLGQLLGSKKVDRRNVAHGWNARLAKFIEALP